MIESLTCFIMFRKHKYRPVLFDSAKSYTCSDAYVHPNALSIPTYAISTIPNIHFLSSYIKSQCLLNKQ